MLKFVGLVAVALIGVAMIVVGALIPSMVETALKAGVKTSLQYEEVDDNKAGSTFLSKENPYNLYVYNITNPTEVLNGKIPVIQEVKVPFTVTKNKYEVSYDKASDTVSYRSYDTYTPINKALAESKITTVNLAYLGAAFGATGNEILFQASTLPKVVPQLTGNTSAFHGALKSLSLATYLGTTYKNLLPTYKSPQAVFKQWNGGAHDTNITGPFELPTNITTAILPYLWNSKNTYSLIRADATRLDEGIFAWAALASAFKSGDMAAFGALSVKIVTELAPSYKLAPGAALTAASTADITVILGYFGAWMLTPSSQTILLQYFGSVKNSIGMTDYTITSWNDVAEPGFVMQTLFSIFQQAIPVTNISVLTPAQSAKLAATVSDPTGAVGTFAISKGAAFAPIPGSLILGFLEFLTATFFMKGALGLDATVFDPNAKTGILMSMTPLELMHGYEEHLLKLGGASYDGIFGSAVTTETEAKNVSATKYITTQKAGNTDDGKGAWKYVEVDNNKQFTNQTDLGNACPNVMFWAADPEASACKVWKETEVIDGMFSTDAFESFVDADPPSTISFYNSQTKRTLDFILETKDVLVEGIKTNKYSINKDLFASSANLKANKKSEAAQKKSDNYRVFVDGFGDMSTSSKMVPIYLGGPRHYFSKSEQKKFKGVTTDDWSKYKEEDLETVLYVEPITGQLLKGFQRLQFNARISASTATGFYKNIYKGGDNATFAVYPIAWVEDYNVLTPKQAQDFIDKIYGARNLGPTLQIVFVIFGVIFALLGFGCLYRMKKNQDVGLQQLN